MRIRKLAAIAVLTFLLQAVRVLFSTLFGFIYDQVFEGPVTAWLGVSGGLAVLALAAPAILGRQAGGRRGKLLAMIAIAARPLLSTADVRVRFFGAVLVAAAGSSYLAVGLTRERPTAWRALVWAVITEGVLRMLGDTFDVSLLPGSLPFMLAACAGAVIGLALAPDGEDGGGRRQEGLSWPAGLGVGGFLFLQVSLLALPGAIARWTQVPYTPVALLTILATAASLFLQPDAVTRRWRIPASVILLVVLFYGYFGGGALAAAGLLVGQILAVAAFAGTCEAPRPTPGRASGALAAGMLFFLLLNFLNAFAFTYPYTLPFMREMGWAVFAAAGLALAGGWVGAGDARAARSAVPSMGWAQAAGLALVILAGIWAVRPLPVRPLPEGEGLRMATWNIHYGYDDVWHTTLPDQAHAMGEAGVDVIALQEVDAGRITSYSVDNAYFLARRLGMRAAYLPAVEHLTGIALLYKGPQVPVESALLPSLQEQTGILRAHLSTAGGELQAHAIWLGLSNEDTMGQIEAALDFIGAGTAASFSGDFNARDDEPEIAAVLAQGFEDPFILLGMDPAPPTDPALQPEKRIDYVFVRGLEPRAAWVDESLASDHRMVVVEIALP